MLTKSGLCLDSEASVILFNRRLLVHLDLRNLESLAAHRKHDRFLFLRTRVPHVVGLRLPSIHGFFIADFAVTRQQTRFNLSISLVIDFEFLLLCGLDLLVGANTEPILPFDYSLKRVANHGLCILKAQLNLLNFLHLAPVPGHVDLMDSSYFIAMRINHLYFYASLSSNLQIKPIKVVLCRSEPLKLVVPEHCDGEEQLVVFRRAF